MEAQYYLLLRFNIGWMQADWTEDEHIQIIDESTPYRKIIECLMYAMLNIQSDHSIANNNYIRFQGNATEGWVWIVFLY